MVTRQPAFVPFLPISLPEADIEHRVCNINVLRGLRTMVLRRRRCPLNWGTVKQEELWIHFGDLCPLPAFRFLPSNCVVSLFGFGGR